MTIPKLHAYFSVASYEEARKKIDKAVKGDDLCTTDADTKKKTRKSRMAKFPGKEKVEYLTGPTRRASFKRIRQYELSSSEDDMENTPAPPVPPPIALASSSLSPISKSILFENNFES